jgi:ubiquinone/menaquinone biosynthesis C-methylase UbiE
VTTSPSAEQIWRQYDAMELRLSAPLSERMLDLAQLQPGMRVLDLATGRGEPAVRAARRVAPDGSVLGVDPFEGMLKMARARADREGIDNLDLRVSSAETLDGVPHAHFDACLCRWGLMYFDAPIAALTASRRALVSGGVVVAALWAEPERVPYYTLPRQVLARHAAVPAIDSDRPGTFYYGDLPRIERDFLHAGLRIELIEEMSVQVMEANSPAELIAWCRAFGLGRLLQPLPVHTQQRWEQDMQREADRLLVHGPIRLGGVSRLVRARSS